MSDTLLLNIIRYLNDMYWRDGLSAEQTKALAAFVLELDGKTAQFPERKAGLADPAIPLSDETSKILHDVFPDYLYQRPVKQL
ncbi:MAG: hypothetical protein WCX65_10500 [bacterium]